MISLVDYINEGLFGSSKKNIIKGTENGHPREHSVEGISLKLIVAKWDSKKASIDTNGGKDTPKLKEAFGKKSDVDGSTAVHTINIDLMYQQDVYNGINHLFNNNYKLNGLSIDSSNEDFVLDKAKLKDLSSKLQHNDGEAQTSENHFHVKYDTFKLEIYKMLITVLNTEFYRNI